MDHSFLVLRPVKDTGSLTSEQQAEVNEMVEIGRVALDAAFAREREDRDYKQDI